MIWTQFAMATAGGTCGALLTQAATFVRERMNKGVEARFTALTLAMILEDYACKCTEPVSALRNHASSRGHSREPTGSIPALADFPDKTDWRSIGIEHAERVLGFRMAVDSVDGFLADVWEHEGREGVWAAASDTAVEYGLRALDAAKRLRRAFGLPARSTTGSFDVQFYLEEESAAVRAREAANVEWNSKLLANPPLDDVHEA